MQPQKNTLYWFHLKYKKKINRILGWTGLIFLFLTILISCYFLFSNRFSVKRFVASLPSEERLVLDYFFRCLIQEDTVGYVLAEEKPMCFYSHLQPKILIDSLEHNPVERIDLFFDGFDSRDALFHRGWKIWEKYKHHFCGRNIFFDTFEEDRELRYKKVIVVNKRLMLPIIDQYFSKFSPLDPSLKEKESLFDALLHDENFKRKFYTHHALMGICLGYGERNARLFQKMVKLFTSMGLMHFTLEKASPDRLEHLEQEWDALRQSFTIGIKDHISRKLLFHFGVGFRADFSDPETLCLQEKYTACHKKLTFAYRNGNFLERTLEWIYLADKDSLRSLP